MAVSNPKGVLYVVATPIGHLDDLSFRAVETLQQVDWIAAEDTRHSQRLMQHYSIATPMRSLHDHNESSQCADLVSRLQAGASIALISDAGTPLISDPGFLLVQAAREAGIAVSPIPGASALIAALSASGLPTARFHFEGFVPRTSAARQALFQAHTPAMGTLVFYESSHRIQACVQDLLVVYGPMHHAAIARELTKTHETILSGHTGMLVEQVETNPDMRKGEFVVLVSAPDADRASAERAEQLDQILTVLLAECSLKTAVSLVVQLTGLAKKQVYARALELKGHD